MKTRMIGKRQVAGRQQGDKQKLADSELTTHLKMIAHFRTGARREEVTVPSKVGKSFEEGPSVTPCFSGLFLERRRWLDP